MNNNEIDSPSNIEPFKVVIRIRPFLQKELNNQAQLNYSIKNNKTIPNNYQIDYNKSIFTIPNSSMLLLQDHRIGGKVTKEFILYKFSFSSNNICEALIQGCCNASYILILLFISLCSNLEMKSINCEENLDSFLISNLLVIFSSITLS